ncbi:amino acid/amide ABC transporter membrane protein 2, HAAT family (TC 3.A.1.4.-) [Palleronia marisminoris]|uniref:Leucine/isoleucine/valine transporter permease subunit n=1 Tax=Palleronia marisminoris TaxID=315423 RepID=A0A1Y5TT43_9RHOB|nr:branched-chain amino acid ABC transporter permease [Palleronia marisminoris]SFH51281.1 amino acid/amide ABC transporter membrane protein 2, HAAT family (TC 3.A.1.4.-) [Palleronia marisminoris]SLN70859.1 leucine/isoleucine/valine transporter permease subunit [Palleronia marisminoris]
MRLIIPLAVVALVLVYPFVVNSFWLVQIGGRTLGFGTIVLSLVFLTAYTGMLSLAQMTVAGIGGYATAYFTAPTGGVGVLLPWPLALVLALGLATLAGLLIGLVAVRTRGIYTLMITLAVAMAFYYLTLQNYDIFNGFTGFNNADPPVVLGLDLGAPLPFFYLSAILAALCYAGVRHVVRTPFGLALQALRDEPDRVRALGYNVPLLRVLAFGLAGFIAGIGGILNLWLNASISPGSVALNPVIDVLMAGVLGGIGHPAGAYVGAFVFTVVDNFAIDFIARERFNTLIGLIFLAIVLFSPDGLTGLVRRVSTRWARAGRRDKGATRKTKDIGK